MRYARYFQFQDPTPLPAPFLSPMVCMDRWRDVWIHPPIRIPSDRSLWPHPSLHLLYEAHTTLRSPHRTRKTGRWHCCTLSLVNVQTGEELGILSIRARSALPQPPCCLEHHIWHGKGEQTRSTSQGISMENNVQFVLSCSGICKCLQRIHFISVKWPNTTNTSKHSALRFSYKYRRGAIIKDPAKYRIFNLPQIIHFRGRHETQRKNTHREC